MTKSYFKNQGVLKAVNLAESEVSSEHCPCSKIKTLINTRILLQVSEHLGFIVCESLQRKHIGIELIDLLEN